MRKSEKRKLKLESFKIGSIKNNVLCKPGAELYRHSQWAVRHTEKYSEKDMQDD